MGKALPEVTAEMGDEPVTDNKPPAAVQPQQSALAATPDGAPPATTPITPTAPGKAPKAPIPPLPADEKGKPQPAAIDQGIASIPTKDGNIQVTPTPKQTVKLDGANDPAQNQKKASDATGEVDKASKAATDAIAKGPGPEKVQPLKIKETTKIQLSKKSAAYETAQLPPYKDFIGLGLPGDVQESFDTMHGPKMKASMAGAKQQVDSATADRDTKRDQTVSDTKNKVKETNADAQKKQDEQVQKSRGAITKEKDKVQGQYKEHQAKFDSDTKAKLGATNNQITQRAQQDQAKIDAEYKNAEQQATAKVNEGEAKAEEEKRKSEEESKNKSWWEKAVDFVKDAFEKLTSLISDIFDAVRNAVSALLDKVKELANSIIDAATKFIQDAIKAFGEVLKTLVNDLIGKIFPELAKKLNEFIDKAVDEACKAVQVVADELKKKIAEAIDSFKKAMDDLINAFKAAVQTALSVLKAIATGDWKELLKMALEAALRLAGIDPGAFMATMAKAVESIEIIVKHPGQFIGNLIKAAADGDKVKITLRFRGREMAHQEIGLKQLQKIEQDISEMATIEQPPKLEGRQMGMLIGPKKKK